MRGGERELLSETSERPLPTSESVRAPFLVMVTCEGDRERRRRGCWVTLPAATPCVPHHSVSVPHLLFFSFL